mgnify:CR=1 FL=1
MTSDQTANLLYSLLFLVLVVSSLAARRLSIGVTVKYALAWLAIFAGAIVLYSFRGIARQGWEQVRTELFPGAPVQDGKTIRVRMEEDGHFHVDAQVNGHTLNFLIDSGATTTTLSKTGADEAGVAGCGDREQAHPERRTPAVLHGLDEAARQGFTHALTMDSDGQHPAALIAAFMRASMARPEAMILGRPLFDASAPLLRVRGRRISNGWTAIETLGAGIADSLYGFRVYPVAALAAVMHARRWMRRFDFDTEAVVRLAWRGVKPINLDAPVRYLSAAEGGVSHFRYLRDNALLSWMHTRLVLEFVVRLPLLLWRRARKAPPYQD